MYVDKSETEMRALTPEYDESKGGVPASTRGLDVKKSSGSLQCLSKNSCVDLQHSPTISLNWQHEERDLFPSNLLSRTVWVRLRRNDRNDV